MDLGSDDKRLGAQPEDDDGPAVSTADAKRRQRLRSLAIAWALAALVVMFFLVTLVRLGANVANRPI